MKGMFVFDVDSDVVTRVKNGERLAEHPQWSRFRSRSAMPGSFTSMITRLSKERNDWSIISKVSRHWKLGLLMFSATSSLSIKEIYFCMSRTGFADSPGFFMNKNCGGVPKEKASILSLS
jgi:hypothetical protein